MKVVRISQKDAILVLIDFQKRLMPAMENREGLAKSVIKLIKGCQILGVSWLITQQYTKGLGPTIPPIDEALGNYSPIEKTSFSAMKEPAFVRALEETGKRTTIIAGIESHVCVLQTSLDLLQAGYHVFLPADCISSRRKSDKKYALLRMAQAGIYLTTYEAVLFELCGGSHLPGFKEISALVKA